MINEKQLVLLKRFCENRQIKIILVSCLVLFLICFIVLVSHGIPVAGHGQSDALDQMAAIVFCAIGIILFGSLTAIYELYKLFVELANSIQKLDRKVSELKEHIKIPDE